MKKQLLNFSFTKKSFLLLIPILFLVSCVPRVTTSVINQRPVSPQNQVVDVFNDKDQIGTGYEILGLIRVADAGSSVAYGLLLTLAKQEVRNMGGNAFLITEHRQPNSWIGTYHQFRGLALNVSDEFDRSESDANLDNAVLAVSMLRHMPRFSISANAGPAWKGGETGGIRIYEDLTTGFMLNFSADYFWSDTFGVRLGYQRFSSTAEGFLPELGLSGRVNGEFKLNTIFPAIVMRFGSNNQRWISDMSFGLGYADFTERFSAENGFIEIHGANVAAQFTFGLQYLITRNLAVGAVLTGVGGVLRRVNINDNGHRYTEILPINRPISLGQTGLLLGIRYHIW